jgi:hypothetical protein
VTIVGEEHAAEEHVSLGEGEEKANIQDELSNCEAEISRMISEQQQQG